MSQETFPHEQSQERAHESREYAFIDVGVVSSAPTQDADGGHHVAVAETRVPSDKLLPVIPPVHGDYYVPPEGTPVLVAYTDENDGVVIGSVVPPQSTPTIEPGERIISHPLSDSAVRFVDDGTIQITTQSGDAIAVATDGTVTINNGDQGAVTDVSIGSTNSNGGATSLTVTRNNDVLL